MPPANQHVGLSGHSRMNSILCEARAIYIVLRRGRYASYSIAWINVFQVHFNPALAEKIVDFVFQKDSYISQSPVSRSIRFALIDLHDVLTSSFRRDDDDVLPMSQPVSQFFKQSTRPFKPKRNFGNKAEIYVLPGQRGLTGDKSRIAAHELHQPDPVHSADGFYVGT